MLVCGNIGITYASFNVIFCGIVLVFVLVLIHRTEKKKKEKEVNVNVMSCYFRSCGGPFTVVNKGRK